MRRRAESALSAASVIATAAGRLGSEYWSLRRLGEQPPLAWSRVLGLETAGWAMLAGLAFIGSVVLLGAAGRGAPLGVELAWLLALPVCSVPALYLTAGARHRLWEDTGDGRAEPLPPRCTASFSFDRSRARPGPGAALCSAA